MSDYESQEGQSEGDGSGESASSAESFHFEHRQGADDPSLAQRIKGSANQIWLAGLGAYVKAEQGGEKLFDSLVKDGELVDRESQNSRSALNQQDGYQERFEIEEPDSANRRDSTEEVEKTLGSRQIPGRGILGNPLGAKIDQHFSAYRGLVEERVGDVKDKATSSWEKLEKAFDERVTRALERLNIPTKADVEALSERIQQLSEVIEKMSASKTAGSNYEDEKQGDKEPD